jgi:hypothetical protein
MLRADESFCCNDRRITDPSLQAERQHFRAAKSMQAAMSADRTNLLGRVEQGVQLK